MLESYVLASRQKLFIGEGFVVVKEAKELTDHAKVVDIDRILIDVLEDTELAFFERQLVAVAEIFVGINNTSLLVLSFDELSINDLDWQAHLESLFVILVLVHLGH